MPDPEGRHGLADDLRRHEALSPALRPDPAPDDGEGRPGLDLLARAIEARPLWKPSLP